MANNLYLTKLMNGEIYWPRKQQIKHQLHTVNKHIKTQIREIFGIKCNKITPVLMKIEN